MTITVQQLIQKLQGFRDDSLISIRDTDNDEFFLSNFIPRGNILTIVISTEEEEEDGE
ncbi:MAG: hypothetical protein ACYT04_46715 [Nostoc sp.]